MLARDDLADYIAHHYGRCDRDQGPVNNCYWGTDARGEYNGCLKTGWKGRECPHWHPVEARDWEELRKEFVR